MIVNSYTAYRLLEIAVSQEGSPLERLRDSLVKSLQTVIEYLPYVLAAIIILIVGYLVGDLVGKGIRVVVERYVQKPLEKTKPGEVLREYGIRLDVIFGGLVKAFIIVVAVVYAITILKVPEPARTITLQIANYLPRLIGGLAVLLIGIPLALLLARFATSILGFTSEKQERHKTFVMLVEKILVLAITVFIIAVAVDLIFYYRALLDYVTTAAPGFITAAIILVIGYIVGDSIATILDKTLDVVVEKPIEKTDFGKTFTELGIDLSGLLAGLVKAFIIAVAIVAAVDAIHLTGYAGAMVYNIANYLPRLIGAIAILTLGLILAIGLAKYIGGFLRKSFPENYADVATLIENFILLGLVAVIITIALNTLQLEGGLVYPLIIGALVIAIGIFVSNTAIKIIVNEHPEFKSLAPFLQFIILLVFLVIGVGALFSQFTEAIRVVETLSWGLAIAFGIVLIPIAFYLARTAIALSRREEEEARAEAKETKRRKKSSSS